MVLAANLGFPRIGAQRELKKALESFWKGESSADALQMVASALRAENWKRQKDAGIEVIPSNDFSMYDQVLDHIQMFGAMPARYAALKNTDALTQYFAMARGRQADGVDVVAMEMTKWFDTNYHYIVPEFEAGQSFALATQKPVEQFLEAKAQGITTRPVILGPVTFLMIGKMRAAKTDHVHHAGCSHGEQHSADSDALALLPALLPVYQQLLSELEKAGAEWVQIDEPYLSMDLDAKTKQAYKDAYAALSSSKLKLCLTTYFEGLRDNAELAFSLPVAAVHVDLVRAPNQLADVLKLVKPNQSLSLGVVDGRNIWKTDFKAALAKVQPAIDALGKDRVMIAPSCSLLHSPVDMAAEVKLDAEVKQWMAYAQQKLTEIATLTKAANDGAASVEKALAENETAMQSRRTSTRIHNDAVKQRTASIDAKMMTRSSAFDKRIAVQESLLKLPSLPTTTIGSFPQTAEVRAARASFKAGSMSAAQYQTFLEEETVRCIRKQEELGIDVLVHGEFERNDMVEYFGEQLSGFVFSQNGWVQSYGSRCVKPPVIFGDVSRPKPMTVDWATFSQSKTQKLMKGMLTGPVTILQWSFVRDDQPRSVTCKQIGLAIRDEVADLEKAGIKIIQVDEAALREGLPLRKADWADYLQWSVDAFRVCASGAKDETQIHTHMCYSEFNDIIEAVARMDADVISIETSRSAMELLDAFVAFKYPNQIGPGVYDIHSPRVPAQAEMEKLMLKALDVLKAEQLWVNPDCGLKTRGWKEVEPALAAMVKAAEALRKNVKAKKAA